MRKHFFILSFFLIICALSFSQAFELGKISPYTALFLSDLKQIESTDSTKFLKRFSVRKANNIAYVHAFIKFHGTLDKSVLSEYDVVINTRLSQMLTAMIPVDKLEEVAMLDFVKRIELGVPVKTKMDLVRELTFVNSVHAEEGSLPNAYNGSDVVVGIVDAGFEYGHVNFYDFDTQELRVKRVWDQNGFTSGTTTSGLNYGKEYTVKESILAAGYDADIETHATHVAGIAAGGDKNNGNVYYGVAPKSDLVFVSFKNDTTADVSVIDGINYIYKYASSVNKPAVVNLSLGYHLGPHDGTSYFDQACDEMQGSGRLLVGAVGNEGNTPIHIQKEFLSGLDTLKTFFSFFETEKYGYTDVWSEAGKNFKIKAVVYNLLTSSLLYETEFYTASQQAIYEEFPVNYVGTSGSIAVFTERNAENNKANAFIRADFSTLNANHAVGIIVTSSDGLVHAWADGSTSDFSGNNISGWSDGDSNHTNAEIGGTGKKIISVGSYNSTGSAAGNISSFSSIGPTIDGRIKPDITAPGSRVVSSFSLRQNAGFSFSNEWNSTKYYYGAMQGTSMAAPVVTGVLALWLQAKNDLTPDEARSVLQRTAINDSYTGDIAASGSPVWGYGKINAYDGLLSILESRGKPKLYLYPNPNQGIFDLLFQYEDTDVSLLIYDFSGRCVYSEYLGDVKSLQEQTVDITHLPRGIYLLTSSGKKNKSTEKFIID